MDDLLVGQLDALLDLLEEVLLSEETLVIVAVFGHRGASFADAVSGARASSLPITSV